MNAKKEQFKSMLLILLVLSSVVLMQLNLFDGLVMGLEYSESMDTPSTKLSAYINPQSFFISFGGLSYTKVYDGKMQESIWGEIRPYILSSFLNYETLTEITKEDYVKAFSDKSLLIRMPISLSAHSFFSLFSAEALDNNMGKIIPYEYILREGNPRSLFVFDKENQTYYQIRHKTLTHDVASIINEVKRESWVEYRKVSDRFSLDITVEEPLNKLNYELIPFEYDFLVPAIAVEHEVNIDSQLFNAQISEISSLIFGSRLDFVKRLRDIKDSVILMYGYGDKSLTFSKDGVISYRKKFEPSIAKSTSFKEAFALAVGKMELFGRVPEGLYLSSVVYNEKSNQHMFKFNYKMNGYAIADRMDNDAAMVITVRENQVVSIDKNIKWFAGEAEISAYTMTDRLVSIDDCIAKNELKVSVYYLQDQNIYEVSVDTMRYFFPIRSDITSIDMRYWENNEDSYGYLIPVWQVVIRGRTYIFNAYNGNLIRTYR